MITNNHQNTQDSFEIPQNPTMSGVGADSLFEVVWRSRWIVLSCMIFALTAGFIYVMKATPIFTSTSRVYVEQVGPRVIEDVQGIMTQSKNYLYTQAELMKSTPIISAALDEPDIRRMATFAEMDNPLAYLKKQLNVSVGKKDDIISVEFDSPYPAEAAMLINTVVDAYITYQSTQKKSTAAEILKILQKQKEKSDIELNEKRDKMLQFQKDYPALTFETRQGNIIIERLATLSESLTAAEMQTVQAKSNYESIKLMVDDPAKLRQYVQAQRTGYYVAGAQESERMQLQLDQIEVEIAERTKQLTSDHPLVINLNHKVETLQNQIVEFEKNFADAQVAVANQEYLVAKESEQEIRAHFEKQRGEAMELNEKLTEYVILKSDVERAENLIEILDDRVKEINVTEDTGALNISILEVARPADGPSKPQKSRILAMALVIGMMLGGAMALARDWMDQRLRSADEISSVLGVPVLGTVPHMAKLKAIEDRGMIVHKKSSSPIAEAYRTVRTAVFFGVPDGRARTMLVTSPAPSDGKSTLASNLAIAMAQADQKTLIIDADLRKSVQHEIFSASVEPGLTSILSRRASLAECIQPTGVVNLNILPAGPEVPNPSEMLNSIAFKKLLQELSQVYDRIIIDSPPVMPVTDSRILAAICDVTILVLRAEKSTRKGSQQARDGLLSVGANLLGAVVNDVSKGTGKYGYYSSSYGYGYGYGYYGRKGKEETKADSKIETIVS